MKDNINSKLYKATEVKLTYKRKVKASDHIQIKNAEDVASLLLTILNIELLIYYNSGNNAK